jgi:DNA-binding response OmpR family regulator
VKSKSSNDSIDNRIPIPPYMRIAILDNDPQQRTLIAEALNAARHDTVVYSRIDHLLAGLREDEDIDLLLWHWQPESEGWQRLRELRQGRPALPVLVVTGRGPEHELASMLADGQCDYLVRPVRRNELPLRVRVLVARSRPDKLDGPTQNFGRYAFDGRAARLLVEGQAVTLTQKEFDLALLFFRNLGQPLSRATIHEAVWPKDAEFSSRTMDTHVSRVRSKLGLRPENGYRLSPVYGYGYQLEQLAENAQDPQGPRV